jgi:hypothetical protein
MIVCITLTGKAASSAGFVRTENADSQGMRITTIRKWNVNSKNFIQVTDMPKMHPLTVHGKIKAFDAAIAGLNMRLADPWHSREDLHETKVEVRALANKLTKQRDNLIAKFL